MSAILHSQSFVGYITLRSTGHGVDEDMVVFRYADPEKLSTRLCGGYELVEVALFFNA